MPDAVAEAQIRTRPCQSCVLCGSGGDVLHMGLDDALFGAPGRWTLRRCANPLCRLVWLDPQPLEEDIGLAYATYYTHGGRATGGGLARRAFRAVRAAYLGAKLGYPEPRRWPALFGHLHPGGGDAFAAAAMFLPAPAGELLDVGSGAGDFLISMRDLGWRVRGVETDPAAADVARGRGLDVHCGDLLSARHPAGSFDAVTLAHVIEHVPEVDPVVAECARILKPGGRLVVLTPNSESWGHRHFGRDWRGLEPPRHIRIFNANNLRDLLVRHGLRPLRLATLAINASATWTASEAIRRARAAGAVHAGLHRRKLTSGLGRQVLERVMLLGDRDAGEDLLAIATRPA